MKVKVVNNAPVNLKQDPLAETIRILAQIIAKYLASEELGHAVEILHQSRS